MTGKANIEKNTSIKGSFVRRALSAHGSIAIVISAFLYNLCFSGTVAVLKDELQLLEQTGEPVVEWLSPDTTHAAAINGFEVDKTSKHMYIHMPHESLNRAIMQTDNSERFITSSGEIADAIDYPWTDFLIKMHYYLTLPEAFGMTIVAIFGVFLFAVTVSGFLAHPNIIKDAFAYRKSKSEQVKEVDLHNRLSVWTAPFNIAVTLTGTMIGLATMTAIAVGVLKYDGDFEAVFEPVFGYEPPADERSDEMANISKALEYMQENHPEKPPVFVIIHDPGTQGQYLQIMAKHPRRLIYADKYNFNSNGDFIDTVGSADGDFGQQVADSLYRVHFGYFGGLPVKIAYVVFGIAMLYIISSGMNIYLLKRRSKGRPSPSMEGAWKGVVWGTPIMFIINFAITVVMPELTSQLIPIYWIGLIFVICLMAVRHSWLEAKLTPTIEA